MVYASHVEYMTLSLMNSLGGESPEEAEDAVPHSRSVTVKIIPKGSTGIIQTLDVYRFWFPVCLLSHAIGLSSFSIQLHQRVNILKHKIIYIIHTMLSTPAIIFINIHRLHPILLV